MSNFGSTPAPRAPTVGVGVAPAGAGDFANAAEMRAAYAEMRRTRRRVQAAVRRGESNAAIPVLSEADQKLLAMRAELVEAYIDAGEPSARSLQRWVEAWRQFGVVGLLTEMRPGIAAAYSLPTLPRGKRQAPGSATGPRSGSPKAAGARARSGAGAASPATPGTTQQTGDPAPPPETATPAPTASDGDQSLSASGGATAELTPAMSHRAASPSPAGESSPTRAAPSRDSDGTGMNEPRGQRRSPSSDRGQGGHP